MDNAEDSRILTSNENQAKHDALISVCTAGSGYSDPFEDYDENTELDDNRSTKPPKPVNSNDIVNSTPCPNIDFNPFKKYLRICPTQRVEIPSEVKNLGTNYRLIDRSLSEI